VSVDRRWPEKCAEEESKITRGHLMPPQHHLHNGLARHADYSIFLRGNGTCGRVHIGTGGTRLHGQRVGLRPSLLAYAQRDLPACWRQRAVPMLARQWTDIGTDNGTDEVKA